MLLWPMVATFGFLALTGLVIALGTSSTERYDFERNRVEDAEAAGVPAAGSAGRRVDGERWDGAPRTPRVPRGRKVAARQPSSSRAAGSPAAGGVATHPAGRRLPAGEATTGWWLIDSPRDGGAAARVVAGPFVDRLEAEWAALSQSPTGQASGERVVHGVRTVTGTLLPTPAPQESAWMLELGQQLTRLGEDWFEQVSDTDPLTTLVVEVAEALIEAGLPLHDCSGHGSAGGVCLTPCAESAGIVVTWHGHERMTLQQLHGVEADTALRRTMSAAVAEVLAQRGFGVQPLGAGCGHLVTSAHERR